MTTFTNGYFQIARSLRVKPSYLANEEQRITARYRGSGIAISTPLQPGPDEILHRLNPHGAGGSDRGRTRGGAETL